MRCTVLRSFNFSRTGVDQNWASRGTEHDIPDDLVPGLVAEGYVRPMGQKMVTSPERKVIEAYHLWVEKSMYGRKYMGVERATFLIGRDGRIARIWRKVRVKGHAEDVLEAVRAL